MFTVNGDGDAFDAIIAGVRRMGQPDLGPLAAELGGIMVADNRSGLLAGTDGHGVAMEPVKDSTIKRGRGGDGPPTVPRGAASRAVANYAVETSVIPGGFRLVGSWPDVPFMAYHATGTSRMVARDPAAIRPDGESQIIAAVDRFVEDLVDGS